MASFHYYKKKKRWYVFFLSFTLFFLYASAMVSAADVDLPKQGNDAKKPYTKSVKMNIENLSMVKNTNFLLKVYNVDKANTIQFQSMDETIVSIQETKQREALLYANNIGNTTITATIRQDGRLIASLQCAVSVRPPAISVKFRLKKVKLNVGASKRVTAIVKPNNTKELPKYSSSDNSIASVSSNGKVTMLALGRAKITASISNGKSASYTVISRKPVVTKKPATTKNPNTTKNPVTTKNPATTKNPTTTKGPATTKNPEATTNP